MSRLRRIVSLLIGIIYAIFGVLMLTYPQVGNILAIFALLAGLVIVGVKNLVYYIRLARFKTGGITVFFKALFFIDLGVFTLTVNNVPREFIMLYVIIYILVSGVIAILRAGEMRKAGASWKFKMTMGIIQAGMGVVCMFVSNSYELMSLIVGITLLFSAGERLVNAFRRSAIMYVG